MARIIVTRKLNGEVSVYVPYTFLCLYLLLEVILKIMHKSLKYKFLYQFFTLTQQATIV